MARLTAQVEIGIRRLVLFSGLTLDLDPTILIVLAILLVPFIVLNGLVFRPFIKVFDERHERVEGALQRAGLKIEEAEAKAAAFEEKMQIATRKGMEARDTIRTAANEVVNGRIAEEKEKLAGRVEDELTAVQKAREDALAAVQVEATRLAEMTASKLLGRGA